MTLINKRFQFDDRFINADSFVARISMCHVGRPFSVTVTSAVHASCGAAQIRSCLQHSTQCMPYKPMQTHLTAQPTDFINAIVCFSRHGWQSASAVHSLVSHSITRSATTSEHSTMSAVNIIISYLAYFLRSLIFNPILNVLLIVNFLLIPV